MKRWLLVVCVVLAGCGAGKSTQVKSLSNNAQTKQGEAYARQIAEGCINKGGGFKTVIHCAVPPHHRTAFLKCAFKNLPSNPKNLSSDETDLIQCGEKYR